MKVKKYDSNGNRLVPFISIHKNVRNSTKQWKDSDGFWHKKTIKVKGGANE